MGATPVIRTSRVSMTFDAARSLSSASVGGLPVTPCMRKWSASIDNEATVAPSSRAPMDVSACRHADLAAALNGRRWGVDPGAIHFVKLRAHDVAHLTVICIEPVALGCAQHV